MPRQWVINASPAICLGKIDRLDVLARLCDELVVPAAVVTELTAGAHDDAAGRAARAGSIGRAVGPVQIDVAVASWDLGPGESEVLSWARAHPEFECIVDDRVRRKNSVPTRKCLGFRRCSGIAAGDQDERMRKRTSRVRQPRAGTPPHAVIGQIRASSGRLVLMPGRDVS